MAHSMPSVNVRYAREAEILAAGRKVEGAAKGSGSSSSSASERSAVGRRTEGEEGGGKEVINCIRRYKVIGAQRLGTVSQTLS